MEERDIGLEILEGIREIKTYKAGMVDLRVRKLSEPSLPQVIITVLDDEPAEDMLNMALLSQPALATDWDRPEEDEAWSHLAQLPSL
ncbi:MAG: hypothetical protein AAF639_47620 [Chloroflexota bacterium]